MCIHIVHYKGTISDQHLCFVDSPKCFKWIAGLGSTHTCSCTHAHTQLAHTVKRVGGWVGGREGGRGGGGWGV